MKIHKNIVGRITSLEHLFLAWEGFRSGKQKRKDVMHFERHLEQNLFQLHRELQSGTYRHGTYSTFTICDPKQRRIHKALVRDRIVHHAIFAALNPLFEPTFIAHSFSCRKGKGTHRGVDALERMLLSASLNRTRVCFALKCDVHQFFASVGHGILLQILQKRIRDDQVMALLREIIGSFGAGKGIPIGNLTSQLFANVYLNEFDQHMKHALRVKHFVRYTDDFVIVSGDEQYLRNLLPSIASFLQEILHLRLHPHKVTIRKFGQGIDFLGYVVLPHHGPCAPKQSGGCSGNSAGKRKIPHRTMPSWNLQNNRSNLILGSCRMPIRTSSAPICKISTGSDCVFDTAIHYDPPMQPLVTILLPTYNSRPVHLRAAIKCVRKQTLTDWELVIHDDPSATDVRDIIKDYLDDPRISFKRSERRLGIGGNWNACTAFGTAPFVQFLFQDDLWDPAFLARASDALKRYDSIGFVAAHHKYLFEGTIDGERRALYHGVESLQLAELKPGKNDSQAFLERWVRRGLRPNLIGEPSFVMMRRSLIESVGPFREDMPQGLDVEYWLRCLVRGDFFFLQESLGQFRVHPAAATARNDADGHGLFDRVGFYDTLLKELPRGTLRTLVKKSLVEQFAAMTQKFRERKRGGGKVGSGGSRSLFRIAIKHPALVLRGMIKSL